MGIFSIRGAITVEENSKECIIENTKHLLEEILKLNNIKKENIINLIFTCTKDITEAYPAVGAREIGFSCAIMCLQEMHVKDSLKMCIRVMLTLDEDNSFKPRSVYLKEAKILRPDISIKAPFSIAIDGPAGSGKSTVSKIIAKRLSLIYVDTGAMFRAVAYYCIQNKINCDSFKEVNSIIKNINIFLNFENGIQKIFLDKEDVTEKIRTQEIAENASKVAKIPEVREKLLEIQRSIAKGHKVIMDGRDVGSNILPNANVKIYLDADIEERAKRRCQELGFIDDLSKFEEVKESISKRDEADKTRSVSPLVKTEDAEFINTTGCDIQAVVDKIIHKIIQRIK